jgi:ATP-dependent DNA helicase RecG
MKLSKSPISKLSWQSNITELVNGKTSANLNKLIQANISTISDLAWVLPSKSKSIPKIRDFQHMRIGELFMGHAKLINVKITPAFGRKGKGRVQLFNAVVVVKDNLGDQYLNLTWFNAYPNIKKILSDLDTFYFLGEVTEFRGVLQITNPQINPSMKEDQEFIIDYPTLNSVPGKYIKSLIDKIPESLWNNSLENIPNTISKHFKLIPLHLALKSLHHKSQEIPEDEAKKRLIYEEFIWDQLKVFARKMRNQKLVAKKYLIDEEFIIQAKNKFPYQLTSDQEKSINDIRNDLRQGFPMMRLLQGDVGCGKTTIALIISYFMTTQNGQVAFMCPTETLAMQHYQTICNTFNGLMTCALLTSTTRPKDKQAILSKLETGEISILIGTHSLFQDAVHYKNLQLVIIDEQHKFGVEQRQRLVSKGNNPHTLIMSATPIPRTLQMAQYGDLEISSIKTMPNNRKAIQTRIVTEQNYEKYLSFIKTRLSLNEQVYIVVPAISESEIQEIKNVEEHLQLYKKFFPEFRIEMLHGKLKNDEKINIMEQFNKGVIHILITTSVIEVGINVINATIMSIYNPNRFGLSSLHQLRGRVGRGKKPGFCFLISDRSMSKDSIDRIKILENCLDGFVIAEADLKNRGQGNLFGFEQSGSINSKKVANIFEHFDIFENVTSVLAKFVEQDSKTFSTLIDNLVQDKNVTSTI